MKIILASANKGKIKELESLLPQYEVIAYSKILGDMDIVEDGDSFKANAIIKTKTVIEKLKEIKYNEEYIVISDDSGITVPALNNEPNIYSARYAGENATDKENNSKLISKLKEKNISKTEAYYTASICIGYQDKIFTTHGWMYGDVTDHQIGDGGFGYDPLFIPNGYNKTLGVLDRDIKKELSHRTKALRLAMVIIESFK
ncbi:MAG: non-canonical purine NTP pyrophosphatase [Campylobacterota bacterium]|nr:non-canonical purine NTP pyrophosphatase [Campylobacterota bacterium]